MSSTMLKTCFSPFKSNIFFVFLLLGFGILLYYFSLTNSTWWNYFVIKFILNEKLPDSLPDDSHFTTCHGVIDRMVNGHWSYRNYSNNDLEEVEAIVRRQRSFHKIPDILQRKDGKCGNVNYEDLDWFRAICNPKGTTPCCFNNTCVNKTVQECQCTECYDFRPKVYAELADWIPDDPTCKMFQFKTRDQVCSVLKNITIFFIGDSFLRQLYISVLGFLEKNNSTNIFEDKASSGNIEKCDKHYRYIAECRHIIKHDMIDCDNSTRIHREEIYLADNVGSVLASMRQLTGKNNSWFIAGFGAHDSYNFDHVKGKLLDPLLEESAKSEWPKLIWYEPHAAGLLKTPRVPQQLNAYRIPYNIKVNDLMTKHNVPVLRFYNMTSLALSYDGSHYGKGVNDVKAQILLNYILEQRSKE